MLWWLKAIVWGLLGFLVVGNVLTNGLLHISTLTSVLLVGMYYFAVLRKCKHH